MIRGRVAVVALAVVCTSLAPLLAQPPGSGGAPPPPPKNLKVLPKDFTRDQVTAIMRGFTNALGVRCTHCHVGQDGNPQSMDYASDEKHEKAAAREMIRMVTAINTDFVSKVAEGDAAASVRCETCHRGRAHPPRPLADLLADTAATQGAEAAVAKYSDAQRVARVGAVRLPGAVGAERREAAAGRQAGRRGDLPAEGRRGPLPRFGRCGRVAWDGPASGRRPRGRQSAVRPRPFDRSEAWTGPAGTSAPAGRPRRPALIAVISRNARSTRRGRRPPAPPRRCTCGPRRR
jgi:hypothetical protein